MVRSAHAPTWPQGESSHGGYLEVNQVDYIRVRLAVKIAQLAPITSAEVFEGNLKVGKPLRLHHQSRAHQASCSEARKKGWVDVQVD